MMTPFSQVCFFLLLLYSKEHINYRIILLQQHSTKRENSYTVLRSIGSLAHKWQFGKKRAKWTTHGVSKSQKRFRSTLKVPKKGQFWQVFENLKFAVKQCYQIVLIRQKLVEIARFQKFKWDILSNFQTMWSKGRYLLIGCRSIRRTLRMVRSKIERIDRSCRTSRGTARSAKIRIWIRSEF